MVVLPSERFAEPGFISLSMLRPALRPGYVPRPSRHKAESTFRAPSPFSSVPQPILSFSRVHSGISSEIHSSSLAYAQTIFAAHRLEPRPSSRHPGARPLFSCPEATIDPPAHAIHLLSPVFHKRA